MTIDEESQVQGRGRIRRVSSGYFAHAFMSDAEPTPTFSAPQRLRSAAEDALKPARPGSTPLPCGFAALDGALQGGFVSGRTYVLAALAGMGKTSLAASVAHRIALAGKSVLVFSLQLAAPGLARRVLMGLVGASKGEASPSSDPPDQELKAELEKLDDLPITIDDAPLFTWMELHERIKDEPALVILDGLEFMLGQVEHQSRDAELWEVMAGLRIVARSHDVPLLAMMRQPGTYKEHFNRDDVSGAVLSNSDALLLLDRPAYHDAEAPSDKATVQVAHNRWGPPTTAQLRFTRPGWFGDVRYPGFD